jgi:hypothetical protein
MGIESLLRLGIKLQDEFHVGEVIPQASIDGFARIGKVLRLAGILRPLTLAKILSGSQTL